MNTRWVIGLLFVVVARCGGAGDPTPVAAEPDAGEDVASAPDAVDEQDVDPAEQDTWVAPDVAAPVAELRVDGVLPADGRVAGGETVGVIGVGFDETCAVVFDQSLGTFVLFVSATHLQVNTPPHSPGKVRVAVLCGERAAERPEAFRYFDEVAVTSVEPAMGSAHGGTPITVRGAGFESDAVLIIGHTKALGIEVLDDRTLIAVTPPGASGAVDVTVADSLGVGRLKKGFRYGAGAEIMGVLPAAGPTAGGTTVAISGHGFAEPVTVSFGGVAATSVTWLDESTVLAVTPKHADGVVPLRVDSAEGTAILDAGYRFHDPSGATLQILHASPPSGSVAGGETVTITANMALGAPSVTFGSAPATVVDVSGQSVRVTAPPAVSPGPVDVHVEAVGQNATLSAGHVYVAALSLTSLAPAEGPTEGGTDFVLSGAGFGSPTVFVGALPATSVSLAADGTLHGTTPPGTPGVVDVRVVDGGREAVLPKAFTYLSKGMELWVVSPGHGSIAGGTWVELIGAGFQAVSEVWFGDTPAANFKAVAPGLVTAHTAPGAVGKVDVRIEGVGAKATLSKGFAYYDPKSLFGGTWGDGADVAVNVTVLDASTAKPVAAAFVFLDDDPATPYQGNTDAAGQITFGGPDLGGAHTISVSKEGYVTYSVVHFDAENVTIFLKKADLPQPSFGNTVAPAIVEGVVTGADKYLVGKPGPCVADPSDPLHCISCASSSECGTGECVDLGGTQGMRCLKACTSDTDCPAKSACTPFGESDHCVPTPGIKVAVCTGSKPDFRVFDIPLGPGCLADAAGKYQIITWPTEVAVTCFGGFWIGTGQPTPEALEDAIHGDPTDVFTPVVMGVARHLLLEPGQVMSNVEIKLDTPLIRTIRVRMDQPPLEDTDWLWTEVYLAYGSDGVVKMPVVRYLYDDEPFLLDTMPQGFSGNIADATWTFYAGARSWGNAAGWSYPRAFVVKQGVTEPQDDRMLRFAAGTWQTAPTGLTESLFGAHSFAEDDTIAVGTTGAIFRYDGKQHLSMPTATKKTLRGVHGRAANDVWAVGDVGTLLHFDGAAWTEEVSPTTAELRGVYAADDGSVVIAGQEALYRMPSGGVWQDQGDPVGAWHAVDGTSPSDVWVVGRLGAVRHFNGAAWTSPAVPTDLGLRAVAAIAPNDVWIAGEGGTLLHFDGVGFTAAPPVTSATLNGLAHRGPSDVLAVGSGGAVARFDGAGWVLVPALDYRQDLHAAALPPKSDTAATFGDHELVLGPIVGPARVAQPLPSSVLQDNSVTWTADPRVQPHYQHIEILVPGPMGPVLIWELIADGDVFTAPLPDFAALQGTPGLQTGTHYLRVTRVYQEGFDIDGFDYTDLSELARLSWAVEYFPFVVKAP